MNSRARLAVIVAGAALAVGLFPALAKSPLLEQMPRATRTTPPPARAQVRVEHELVAAAVIEEPAERHQAARRSAPPTRPPSQPPGFVSRTRQLLLGDGRHRPEPFPRVGQ